jgi:hypothetical protein
LLGLALLVGGIVLAVLAVVAGILLVGALAVLPMHGGMMR